MKHREVWLATLTAGALALGLIPTLEGREAARPDAGGRAASQARVTSGEAVPRPTPEPEPVDAAPSAAPRRAPAEAQRPSRSKQASPRSQPARATGHLAGRIWDERFQPLSRATVTVETLPAGTRANPVVDEGGSFEFEGAPGRYRVSATAAGRVPHAVDLVLGTTHEVRIVLRLSREGKLELRTAGLRPDAELEAVIQSRHGPQGARIVRKERAPLRSGEPTRVAGLLPGAYRARLVARTGSLVELGPWSSYARVDPGRTVKLDLALSASPLPSVCGQVRVLEGEFRQLALRVGNERVESSPRGTFQVVGLERGPVLLEVETPGYVLAPGSSPFVYDGTPALRLSLQAVPLVSVGGRVTLEQNSRTVRLRGLETNSTWSTTASSSGVFRFSSVPAGQAYMLTFGDRSREIVVPATGISDVLLAPPVDQSP